MTLQRKVFMCRLGENTHLNTKQKWQNKFKPENFQDNLVSCSIDTEEYALVTDIQAEITAEAQTGIVKEYFFLVVDEIGDVEIGHVQKDFVAGYFSKSTRYLSTLVDLNNGQITDQHLAPNEAASTPARFMYFVEDRILYYEFNKHGVGYFDGRFYRYLDTIFGEDAITVVPIMRMEAMEQAIDRTIVKKASLKVAASNVRFVNKLIGLRIPQQFAESLGDENYNITIIVSSNRSSHLGERFVTSLLDKFAQFRRKDEVKKLELQAEGDDPYDFTKELRQKFDASFQTLATRSRRISPSSFKSKVVSYHSTQRTAILATIQ